MTLLLILQNKMTEMKRKKKIIDMKVLVLSFKEHVFYLIYALIWVSFVVVVATFLVPVVVLQPKEIEPQSQSIRVTD